MRKIKNVDYQEIINSINLSMEMVHHYKQYVYINYYVFIVENKSKNRSKLLHLFMQL